MGMTGKAVRKNAPMGNGAGGRRPGGTQTKAEAGGNAGKPVRMHRDSTTRQNSTEGKPGENGMGNDTKPLKAGGKHRQEKENHKKKRPLWLILLLVAAVVGIALFLLRGCNQDLKRLILDMPEYEESVGYGGDGDGTGSGDTIDLAVIPDFTVSKENPNFVIPYPENAYDVEFSFVDAESGEERYHTKRVKPGAIIEIPAYEFCDKGEHLYRIEVEVYDCDNYVELPSAVALEMKITKE